MKSLRLVVALVALTACAADDPQLRFAVPTVPVDSKVPVSVGSVEIREVSLPLYADQETIALQGAGGAVISNDNLLWADDPSRTITEGLAISLAALTRARVAAEPWPFFENPDVRVEIRFSEALAGSDGQYRFSGQYFVAASDGLRRDVARRFSVSEPYDALNSASIAGAQARAIDRLARLIASDGL